MNEMRFDGYGYPDMNLINNLFLQKSNSTNNMITDNYNSSLNTNMNNNLSLAGAYEGYIRGNMYNNLYKQYKNYKPAKLVPDNEQAELLLNLNQLSFAAHDIRLYLDVHPNDTEMIKLYNKYQEQANEATRIYEQKYGPIMQNSLSNINNYSWETYSWPWEMGDK